jgi:hypothetical protein
MILLACTKCTNYPSNVCDISESMPESPCVKTLPFCRGFHSFTMTVLYHPVKDCSSSVLLSQMVPEVDCPFLPSKCNFNTGNHVIVTNLTHRYTVITEHEVFCSRAYCQTNMGL